MELFHGHPFFEYCQRQQMWRDLLDRAVKKGILTDSGADYLRRLAPWNA